MKFILNKNNHRQIYKKIKNQKPRKLSIFLEGNFFSANNPVSVLKNVVDFAIQENADLEIYNVPFCLIPGYKRYLKLEKAAKFKKIDKCRVCQFADQCPGIKQSYLPSIEKLIKPVVRGLTDLERCMIEILSIENGISTERILKLAEEIDVCASCSSGGEVFRVADQLIRKKLVRRELKKGKYFWWLN